MKPCRGMQRKMWRKVPQLSRKLRTIRLQNIVHRLVDEALRCREYKDFVDGFNSKVKSFCKDKLFARGWGSRNTM